MYLNILTNNKNLFKKFSRREILLLLASLPLLNAFEFENCSFNDQLKRIISKNGTALIAKVNTGQIIGCSNFNKAYKTYTIGSLAKIITTSALLEENLLDKDTSYYCRGYEIIDNKKVYCWNPNGHGKINTELAIAKSCNLFFKNAAKNISTEDLIKYYQKYHLNKQELINEENYKQCINLPSHSISTDIALGTDRNLLLSPLQMLSLATTLARDGIYKPLWLKNPPEKETKLQLKPSTISIVRNGMIGASSTGTAKLLTQKGFNAAAKTGTSPFEGKKTHGWCIGFTPISEPQLAFCIFIDHGTGFSDAVPITAKVLKLCKKFHYI